MQSFLIFKNFLKVNFTPKQNSPIPVILEMIVIVGMWMFIWIRMKLH